MAGTEHPPITHDHIDCDRISFEAHLQSVDPIIAQGVFTDQELIVALKGKKVVAITDQGGVVGSIIENLLSLINCINHGHNYQARVIRKLKGNIVVLVHPRGT